MRILAALHKEGNAVYLSHLDLQRTLQRGLRRADLPLSYSQGFNPHPLLCFATALSTGAGSCCEWFDVTLEKPVSPADFQAGLNASLPEGLSVSDAMEAPEGLGSLASRLQAARYLVTVFPEDKVEKPALEVALTKLLSEKELTVQKRTKGGVKPQNIRPQIFEARVQTFGEASFTLDVLGELTAGGGLRTEALVNVLLDFLGSKGTFQSRREEMFFAGIPKLPTLEKGLE